LQSAVELKVPIRKAELARAVCDYIREDSTSRITLKTLGAKFGVSPFHLQRTFTEVMGMSPREYLEEFRVSNLRRHLARGSL